jgi:DNA polymerase-1
LRQAVNARIQTTSADIVNTNLTDLSNALQSMGGRVVLTVHDSILFQLPKGTPDVKALLDRIIVDKTREKFPWLPVKWKYDVGRGPSYGECEKF